MTEEAVVDFRGGRRSSVDDPAAPAPECPIEALGQLNGHYWFLSPSGELRTLEARQLAGDAGILSLFDGNTAYLCHAFPAFDRDGHFKENEFNPKRARQGLIAMAARAGLFDPETSVRGRGIWRGPGNRLICHAGDQLLFGDGARGKVGVKFGAAIYPARPPVPPPAVEPAPAAVAKAWRDDFRLWRYRPLGLGGIDDDRGPDGLAADLLFGVSSLALLGAAPAWRVHLLIKAVHGSGKSTLLAKLEAALGPQAILLNNFSEAGFRNSLANEGRAVLLDEAEGDDGGVINAVVRVIRQMSGGDGVKGARGDLGGTARHFEIAGCAFLACINMPVLLPQDLSRIVVLEMLPSIAAHEGQARAAVARAAEHSAGLRARALYGWPRFEANLAWLRAALIARGCSGRQADQLGGLLAASAMMLEDQPIDAGIAADLAESVVPLIETMHAEEADGSDALRCWRTLATKQVNAWRGGDIQTVGSLLLAAQSASGEEARRTLNQTFGMRLISQAVPDRTMPEAPCLYVANQHQFLREVYRDTPWREGGWAHSLARLDGARPSRFTVRVGGLKQRAVALPLQHLPRPGGQGEPDDTC